VGGGPALNLGALMSFKPIKCGVCGSGQCGLVTVQGRMKKNPQDQIAMTSQKVGQTAVLKSQNQGWKENTKETQGKYAPKNYNKKKGN